MGLVLSALDLGINLWGGSKAAKAQKRQQQRYLAAVEHEQQIWDKTFGPVQSMWQEYLTGNEGTTNQTRREGAVRKEAESFMRLAAPSIAENTKQAQVALNENLAARGLSNTGVAAAAVADLESERLALTSEARNQALATAQGNWENRVQGFMSLGGPRPTLSSAYGSAAGMAVPQVTVDTRGVVDSLMRLASRQKPYEPEVM